MQPNSDNNNRSSDWKVHPSKSVNQRKMAKFTFGLKLLFGICLLALIFRFAADLRSTVKEIRAAKIGWLMVAIIVAIAGELLTAFKWKLLLNYVGEHLPLKHAIKASFVGMFYNNLLPGSVGGDIARALHIASHVGGKARAAASAFMQRNSGMGGLLLVANFASWIWFSQVSIGKSISSPFNKPAFWFAAASVGYISINCILMLNSLYLLIWQRGVRLIDRQGNRPRLLKILNLLHKLHLEVQMYRSYWTISLAISIATQLIDCTMVFMLAQAIGLSIPYFMFLIVVPLVTLAAMTPITFNGIGLREMAYVLLFSGTVLSNEKLVGLSLLQLGMTAFLSTMGGIVQLYEMRINRPRPSNDVIS